MTIIFLIFLVAVCALYSMIKVFNEVRRGIKGIVDTSFVVIFALVVIATFMIFVHYSFLVWYIVK